MFSLIEASFPAMRFSRLLTDSLIAGFLVMLSSGTAFSQGLIGIGHEGSRVTQPVPLKVGIGAWAGYDTNANTGIGGRSEETAFYGGRRAGPGT